MSYERLQEPGTTISPFLPPAYGYMPVQEVATLFDKAIAGLKDTLYYAMVENTTSCKKAFQESGKTIKKLSDAVDTSDANPVALNLQNLLRYMAYSISSSEDSKNISALAQECLALLEPVRAALLRG